MQRVPLTAARCRGHAALGGLAGDEPVLITRWGHPAAVITSAEWMDEDLRWMREAALTVLDGTTDLVAQRSPRHTLEQACERLGVDAAVVRRRAAQRAED